jgi:hypothetical protein
MQKRFISSDHDVEDASLFGSNVWFSSDLLILWFADDDKKLHFQFLDLQPAQTSYGFVAMV